MLEVLAPAEGALRDGPCPACGGGLPFDAWHHVLVSCPVFPSHVLPASLPWLALGREFGLGYPLVAATAQYLPVLEAARDLLVVSPDDPVGARVALGLPGAQLGGGAAPGAPPGGLGLGGLGEPEEPSEAPGVVEGPRAGSAVPRLPGAFSVGPAELSRGAGAVEDVRSAALG